MHTRHVFLAALWLLGGCSLSGSGLGHKDTGKTGTTTTATGVSTSTSTSTSSGSTTTTTSGTSTSACLVGPTGGVVPPLADCTYVPAPSGTPFSARVEWNMTQAMVDPSTGVALPAWTWAEYDGWGSVYQAPTIQTVTDDNGDGVVDGQDIPDIALVMSNPDDRFDGVLRLIQGDGSVVHDSVHWLPHTNANGTDEYAPYRHSGLAMADIDGDGLTEIATMVTRQTDELCFPAVYEVQDTASGTTIALDHVYTGNFACGAHAPAMADLDSNGTTELIFGRSTFTASLAQLWYGTGGRAWYGRDDYPYPEGYWNSGYHSVAWDMDGDGTYMEVVAGRTVYNWDGSTFCELGWYEGSTWVEATDGYPAVADLIRFSGDIEGEPEIVLTGNEWVRVFHGVPDYDSNGLARCTMVAELPNDPALDTGVSGSLPTHPTCDPYAAAFGGPPNIADFDGDGDQEVAVAGGCWFSVFDFAFNGMYRYAMAQTKDWSSASTGSTVFDFNGDGASEVVFSDEEAVYVWGVDGTPGLEPWDRLTPYLVDTEHKSWTVHEYPLVADVDADGKAEIVVVNSHLPGYMDHFGLYVLGSANDDWVSARSVWHQHAYYVTNVTDDGDVGYAAPNYAPYTPEDLNSFRSQSPGSFGALAAPNLFVESTTCQDVCGDVTVWLQAGNEGEFISADPGVVLSLYGVTATGQRVLIGDTTLGMFLNPTTLSDSYGFLVTNFSQYAWLEAEIDDPALSAGGAATECDETDNVAVISLTGLCP